MTRRFIATLMLAAVGCLGVGAFVSDRVAAAFPEPSAIPLSWELSLKHGSLERLILPIDGKSRTFWYMHYTVTNNSGRDVLFTPSFEILSDNGVVTSAFKDVPTDVFRKIKEIYNSPLLESPNSIYGKLLQGDDNAKDGVVIFPALDPDGRDFKLFVTGLSGETAEVKNPVTGDPVILQKALELDFNIPGQAIGIEAHAQLRGTKWIMKEEIKSDSPATQPATAK